MKMAKPIDTTYYTPIPISANTTELIFVTQDEDNTTMSHSDIEDYLQRLSDENTMNQLLDIILISFMSIIGTVGNAIVIYVYLTKFKPTSTRCAILVLACFDLVSSCFFMPGEILVIRFSHNFPSAILCKCIRTMGSVVVLGSFMTITTVTYDRYRRICHPTGKQLTVKTTRKILLACLLASSVFSIPAAFVYGFYDTRGPHTRFCDYDTKYRKTFLPLLNVILHTVLFAIVVFIVFGLYGLIGRVIIRQTRLWRSLRKSPISKPGANIRVDSVPTEDEEEWDGKQIDDTNSEDWDRTLSSDETKVSRPAADTTSDSPGTTNVTALESRYQTSNSIEDQESKPEHNKTNLKTKRTRAIFRTTPKLLSTDTVTRKTTQMLFIITIVFIISFLPYITLHGLLLTREISAEGLLNMFLSPFLTRSFFLNSVTNCFIYAFCCPKFRRESKGLILNMFPCYKNKSNALPRNR